MGILPDSTVIAADSTPGEQSKSTVVSKGVSGATVALLILFAINTLNFFDRQLMGALAEPIRKEFHLSDTGLGLLGTVFTLIYAVVGRPSGA